MNTGYHYFDFTLKCGEQVIHTEIIKVKPLAQPLTKTIASITYYVKMALLYMLFARDSMSFYSRVRPIRERFEATKMRMFYTLIPLLDKSVEERYVLQMETRDKSLGYLLDEPLENPY